MSWSTGDPGAMRAFATEVRAQSKRLRDTAAGINTAQPASHHFQGPYQQQVVADLRSRRLQVIGLADRLDALGAYIERTATTVAQEQHRLEVERIRRAAEAEDRRRREQEQQQKRRP